MDKRFKPRTAHEGAAQRDEFFRQLSAGGWSLSQAVVEMRKLSRLTQPEFARHRGISVQALRQIESGRGNPTVRTLDQVARIFGLRVGFVPIRESGESGAAAAGRAALVPAGAAGETQARRATNARLGADGL